MEVSAVVEDAEKRAFDSVARFYDEDGTGPPTELYGRWFRELAERHGGGGRRVLDMGCATGLHAVGFAAAGYEVTGCDNAPEMVAVARGRPGAAGIRFVEADLRRLPDLGEFDLCCAMTGTLAHLHTDDELTAVFLGVARSLSPDGVFLFDLGTTAGFDQAVRETRVVDREDQFATWRVTPRDPVGDGVGYEVLIDRFVAAEDGGWRRMRHRNLCRHRDERLIRELLVGAGFECVAVHGLRPGGLREHGDDHADRCLLYVARPTAGAQEGSAR